MKRRASGAEACQAPLTKIGDPRTISANPVLQTMLQQSAVKPVLRRLKHLSESSVASVRS
jgi:hypothetical protein